MGPRSHERGNNAVCWCPAGAVELQWGRVLMNAETCRCQRLVRRRQSWLQWGRVLMNAETYPAARVEVRERSELLQWGRVLMNAETFFGS